MAVPCQQRNHVDRQYMPVKWRSYRHSNQTDITADDHTGRARLHGVSCLSCYLLQTPLFDALAVMIDATEVGHDHRNRKCNDEHSAQSAQSADRFTKHCPWNHIAIPTHAHAHTHTPDIRDLSYSYSRFTFTQWLKTFFICSLTRLVKTC